MKNGTMDPDVARKLESIEKFNFIRVQDMSTIIFETILPRYQNRGKSLKIMDIGAQTGKTTETIAQTFPYSVVYGVDSDSQMIEYARLKHSGAGTFISADIKSPEFCKQLRKHVNLEIPFVDIIISTHLIRLDDPQIEIIIKNLSSILKPNGNLYATFSVWSDLFLIGLDLAREMLEKPDVHKMERPCWNKETKQLKDLLIKNDFGTSPEIKIVTNQIKFHTLKRIQDCIRFIYPLSSAVPEHKRLEFFSLFFERFYDSWFDSQCEQWRSKFDPDEANYRLNYEYLSLCSTKCNNQCDKDNKSSPNANSDAFQASTSTEYQSIVEPKAN